MFRGWDAGDTVALASVIAAVIATVVSVTSSARTVRQALRDRHLSERVAAYADFLATQDARFDAYDRARTILGPDFTSVDPGSEAAQRCREDIDDQRVAAWAVQARLQLLTPDAVRAAADAYAGAITGANPMRKLPGGGKPHVGLSSAEKGRLKDEFVAEARKDIDAT